MTTTDQAGTPESEREKARDAGNAVAESVRELGLLLNDCLDALERTEAERDLLAVRYDQQERDLEAARNGIVTYPFCQVFGRNAVVLLTREMIERMRDDYGAYPAGSSPVAADIYGEMGMALMRLDAAARAETETPE